MAELIPYPFESLIKRMFEELEKEQSIFDYPAKKFFCGTSGKDYSVKFHGKESSSPLGPASGPQTQMAQNILLSWLGGSRIMELKTVQILDELEIPRPCIDMQTIGYNVEWSQELRIEQSLHEYVKGFMLIEILKTSGKLELSENFRDVLFDMSVGYDLKGIKSDKVRKFIEGMLNASELIEFYRNKIPNEYSQFRDLKFETKISDTLTLSTFHGCPPDEIEKIIDYLFKEYGLNCVVKLNPTLLGKERVNELLNTIMGYKNVIVPNEAFDNDTSWEQAQGFVERLGETAKSLNLGFGVKFNNTLIVENHRDFFPDSEKVMYLSGTPLHILGINLVKQFRSKFGDKFPISFSAGIDSKNFADAVALGLTPITVCSDFLKVGGYSRSFGYFKDLNSRMDVLNVCNIENYILNAFGNKEKAIQNIGIFSEQEINNSQMNSLEDLLLSKGGEAKQQLISEAKILNTNTYFEEACSNKRYGFEKNSTPPRKVGTMLELFDCLTCDKCIPVCPNDANFALKIPPSEKVILEFEKDKSGWSVKRKESLKLEKKYQIANFADFCNECGNCDIFCPEDGGPYLLKPRFFGTIESFKKFVNRDGFFVESNSEKIFARFDGKEFQVSLDGNNVNFSGPDFNVKFSKKDPENTISGEAKGRVSLLNYDIMIMMKSAILESMKSSYVKYY